MVKIRARFQTYPIRALRTFLRYLIITEFSDKIFDDFCPQFSQESLEAKNVRFFVHHLDTRMHRNGLDGSSTAGFEENKLDSESELKLLDEKNNYRGALSLDYDEQFQMFNQSSRLLGLEKTPQITEISHNHIRAFLTNRNNIARKDSSQRQQSLRKGSMSSPKKPKNQLGHVRRVSQNNKLQDIARRRLSKDSQFLQHLSIRPALSSRSNRQKILKAKNKHANVLKFIQIGEEKLGAMSRHQTYKKQQSLSAGRNKSLKFSRVEFYIHHQLKPNRLKIETLFTAGAIVLLYLVNLIGVWVRVPLNQRTQIDIEERSVLADIFSWVQYGQMATAFQVDVCRASLEGWIDDQKGNRLLPPNQEFREHCVFHYKFSNTYIYLGDAKVDVLVRNISLSGLFDYERFFEGRMGIWVPRMFQSDPNRSLEYDFVEMPKKGSIQFVDFITRKLGRRNYFNETENIPRFGGDPTKRYLDPLEDAVRMNNYGNFSEEYNLRRRDFYEFLKRVAKLNEHLILWSTLVSVIFGIVTIVLVLVYYLLKIGRIRRFYEAFFSIRVSFLRIEFLDFCDFWNFLGGWDLRRLGVWRSRTLSPWNISFFVHFFIKI